MRVRVVLVLLVRPGHRVVRTDSPVTGSFFNLFRVVFKPGRVFDVEHPPTVERSINQNGLLLLLAAHGSFCACVGWCS